MSDQSISLKTYAGTWLALLGLTLGMILVSKIGISKEAMLGCLLLGMTVKAGLISSYFMHLRFERLALVATVVVSVIFCSVALYFLIAVDGRYINVIAPR